MAELTIIYWRDIPAQVVVKKGRKSEKRELPEIFIQSIDRAAMVSGAGEADDYLAEWRRAAPTTCDTDDLVAEADAAVARLVAAYHRERLIAMAKNGGHEPA